MTDPQKPRVLVILTEKSSGSTILKDSLEAHTQINVVAFTQHNENETFFWLKAAYALGLPREDFLQSRPPMFPANKARADLVELLSKNLPTAVAQRYSAAAATHDVVFEGWHDLVLHHQPIFLEKTPHHLQNRAALRLLLQYIQSDRADVRILMLVRNPLEMIYSAWSRWAGDLQNRQYDWQVAYENWLWLRPQLPAGTYTEIRYEELVQEPEAHFQQIAEWLTIPYETTMAADVHRSALGRFKTDPLFTLQLDDPVRELAHQFGYSAEDLDNPLADQDVGIVEELQSLWQRRTRIYTRFMIQGKRMVRRLLNS